MLTHAHMHTLDPLQNLKVCLPQKHPVMLAISQTLKMYCVLCNQIMLFRDLKLPSTKDSKQNSYAVVDVNCVSVSVFCWWV